MYREIQSQYSARKIHGAAQPSYVYPMVPGHPIGMSKLRCIDDTGGGLGDVDRIKQKPLHILGRKFFPVACVIAP